MTEPVDVTETRAAYDTVAVSYAEILSTTLAEIPADRAMLGMFAELVQTAGGGPVADLGCGPGRITAYLDSLGLSVFGVDLSPAMVAVARASYPGLHFDEGSIAAVDVGDASLAGVVAWYSIIHTPPERLPGIFAEFERVLAPGGYLQLAFQVGDEVVHHEQAYGHEVSLHAYRLSPDRIIAMLHQAGFAMHTCAVREPEGPREKNQQAYLLMRKAGAREDLSTP